MNTQIQERRDHRFVIGFLAGTFVGAGLALWLAPRSASELRERVADSASTLGARVGEAVDEVARRGQDLRDGVAETVAHSANEVARYARAAKRGRTA